MSGLFGTLNTATKGLNAQQTALQTIGHNVANANTTGYTRQLVTMQADFAQSVAGVGQIGTGVRIGNIDRVSDHYVNTQLRDAHSTTQKHESLSDIVGQLEAVFNEPSDSGLSNQISEVFNAWTYLASNPEQSSARTMLVQTTETFTDTIHHMANSMESLHKDTLGELSKDAMDVNSTLKQLEGLNHQIWQSSVRGFTPNDLLDQQDRLLTDLAGKIDITVEKDQFNRASVDIAGTNVLNSSSRKEVAVVTGTNEDGEYTLSDNDVLSSSNDAIALGSVVIKTPDSNEGTLVNPSKGSMRGTQEALVVISDMQAELDDFAFSFTNAVNLIHSGGDVEDGQPFFEVLSDSTGAAKSIRTHQALRDDPDKVVSGKSLDNEYSGDGSRAQAIASLQNQTLSKDFNESHYNEDTMKINSGTKRSTLFGRYNSMVTEIGIVKQQEDNMLETQNGVMQLLTQRRESISGVDINEEVVDMIKYSSAFQANSRVLQTISEMLDTLINRTGV
ncbi:flagellar hook-associated protein FlgK [Alkalibacterium olivapovliticus]|uniref:Flagellar hook-associated protein 1 n=1 Tax=Alkalibacterium olivapovliticus TaxID=99907 RepID=A0A2T0VZ72_9LACT|nr:flagellar hook-associated protein FlgK [Alkalibacterium olivapovliticus]PRY77490.1 flagellar hook-associated protein 1 FlgK [Alkalibacterium olivapovliticus]